MDNHYLIKARWSLLIIAIAGAIAAGCSGGGSDSTPATPVAPNWGTAVLIESNSSNDAQYPQIAIDLTGNAIAVWQQFGGFRFKIQANRYVLNVGWGTPVTIDTGGPGPAGTPQIAMDPAGNAIAVWLQWNGNRFGIFANRYTAGGSWGTAVAIDTGSSGASSNPDTLNNRPMPHYDRYQQFYLSMDIDFTRIPTRSKPLKALLTIFSFIKIPFPALEYNTLGQFKFHPIYF